MGNEATSMKIAVAGLWHLGSVTAACLAEGGHDVIGYDSHAETIAKLQLGQAPLFEPRLDDLIAKGQESGKLKFTTELQDLSQADILWVTFDTPVDDNDIADVQFVTQEIIKTFSHLKNNALVIISSQVPVGTTRQLIQHCNY